MLAGAVCFIVFGCVVCSGLSQMGGFSSICLVGACLQSGFVKMHQYMMNSYIPHSNNVSSCFVGYLAKLLCVSIICVQLNKMRGIQLLVKCGRFFRVRSASFGSLLSL
jgi:hypothetical protein